MNNPFEVAQSSIYNHSEEATVSEESVVDLARSDPLKDYKQRGQIPRSLVVNIHRQ